MQWTTFFNRSLKLQLNAIPFLRNRYRNIMNSRIRSNFALQLLCRLFIELGRFPASLELLRERDEVEEYATYQQQYPRYPQRSTKRTSRHGYTA